MNAWITDMSEYISEMNKELERAEVKNTKLQERIEWLEDELRKQMSAASTFMAMARTYQEDNKKLREFAKLYLAAVSIDCGFCPYNDPELCDTETDPMCKGCRLWEEMQKLGINIDS